MDSLRIAHVSNVIGGGMGTVFRVLLPAQVQRGHQVSFFVSQVAKTDLAHFAGSGVDMRIIKSPCRLARELRTFDIVHMHSADLGLLVAGWISRRPTVFTLHGLRAQTRSVSSVSRRNIPTLRGVRRRAKRLGLSLVLRHAMAEVTAVSEFLAEKAVMLYRVNSNKVTVVYSGVDLQKFGGRSSARDGRGGTVGWTGRLVTVKRLDLLLQAAAEVKAQGGAPGLSLVIVGDGPLREELAALAVSLGIGEIVRFAGQVDDPEEYLASMDLFAFPSQNEGAPGSVNEALAAGLPVVVMEDGGGAAELVVRSGGGVVVRDPAYLAGEISALLRDGARRRALGQAGEAYALRELGPETWAARYDAVYARAAGRRRH